VLFEISVAGDPRAAVQLRDWLLDRPDLSEEAVRLVTPVPAPGDMGSLADWVTVAGTAISAGSLALAVAGFLQVRRTVVAVTIRRGDVEVSITGTGRAALDEAARRLDAAASGHR
jgi:hypothetical protein